MNLDQGSMPMPMSSMPRPRVGGWMSWPGYPERSWWCRCNSLHRDLILSRIRLMPMMKSERGALVPVLGAASSGLRLPRWQRTMTRRWVKCHRKIWRRTSLMPWSFWMDLECFPLPGMPLSTSCCQIFVMRIGRNMTTQDQSRRRHDEI
jgi:hypothetical protein